ncbi:hypothetical protein TNCV_3273151 [Trichonephila clavipes]|nr:hypothetical protein TNCV_3273151 [Trichonephila clavipes]
MYYIIGQLGIMKEFAQNDDVHLIGLGLNPGEDVDACKCILPLRHGGTLNSNRAASSLTWLVEDEDRCFVKAEMKKKVTYKPSVQIRTTCQVFRATCTCPAGGTPAFCKHVFALLHAINDYIAKKLYEALNFFRSHFFI